MLSLDNLFSCNIGFTLTNNKKVKIIILESRSFVITGRIQEIRRETVIGDVNNTQEFYFLLDSNFYYTLLLFVCKS